MDQQGKQGDLDARNTAPAVSCPFSLFVQLENALSGISNYYGRQRLAPYQHEAKAWVDVRESLLAASRFRKNHPHVTSAKSNASRLPSATEGCSE